MMFRRKLWKRVLPMILSFAMVLEAAPVTAFAAEYGDGEAFEEAVLEENETNDGNKDSQNENDDAQGGKIDMQNEAGNVPEDDTATADEKVTTKEMPKDLSENKTQTVDTDADGDNAELAAENAENSAAALDTKIVVDKSILQDYCNIVDSLYKYDVDKKVILVKYDEQYNDPFESLLTKIQAGECISVEVDGKTDPSLAEDLNYQWQKADSTNLAADTVPAEAGDYMLVVTLDAVENICTKAEIKIPFTIAKRQLTIALPDAYDVVPGTTVGAFKTDFRYALKIEGIGWNDDDTEEIDEASYIDTVSLAVYNAYQTETPLADDVKLLGGTDYVVSVKPVLKQTASSNYAIPEETVLKLKSYGWIDTWIEAVQKNPEELITKVYDETSEKQINYETDIKNKLTISVNVHDANADEEKTLDKAVVTEVWFDAAKQELGEGAEFAPQTAGTYYLGFRYYPTGEDANIYKACKDSDFIKVVIERAPLILVPALKDDAEVFYTGMTEADVLKYADYKLLNAKNEEITIDRDTFWGVSYDDISANNTTNTRQSYEPVFRLMRAEKDADGNPAKDETGRENWTENGSTAALDASKYCYRLVFTGKKAVYTATGALSGKEIDVNGSDADAEDKNHAIVTTADVLSANYAVVPVAEAKKTKIDVSGILQQNFNTTNLNDLYQPTKLVSKVYDANALYEPSRAEYKKAVVTSTDDNQEVAKNYDSAITYTWYQINRVSAVYDDTDPENPKQTGWVVAQKTQVGGTGNSIPTVAGEYMLEIRFAKTGYVSCSETIYYRIDKQLLVVDIEKIPAAFKNESVTSYTYAAHYEGTYNVYVVPQNQYSESVKTEDNLLKDWYKLSFYDELSGYSSGRYYKLNWYVEQVRFDENNMPVRDDAGNILYDRLNQYDELSTTEANTYRLGVELTAGNNNYTNYEIVYDAEMSPTPAYTTKYHNNSADITVSEAEVGTVEIALALDAQKLTTTKDYDGKPFYGSANEAWEAVKNALTVKNVQTGEAIAQADWPQFVYDVIDEETNRSIDFDEMVYGGSYTLLLYALGDTTYQFAYLDDAATYTINRLPLTVTPVLAEDIPAGTYTKNSSDGVIYNLSKTEFAGYIEADAPAFQYGTPVFIGSTKALGFGAYAYEEDGQPYYHALSATVSKAGNADQYEGYIKYGNEYAVKLDGELAYPYSRNYEADYVRKIFQATSRGNATTSSFGFPKNTTPVAFGGASLAQRNDQTDVLLTPVMPIPYVTSKLPYTDVYGNVISDEGNYFEFEIQAPNEFLEDSGNCEKYCDGFIYRSSIEAAGGYVLKKFGETAFHSGTNECIVVFPVKEKEVKTFEIIWENGYTEKYTIDFTNAVLKEDLTKAVVPKSLSFNNVNKKMAVGDEQQLDVKIKKAQINDIIHIDYRVTQGQDVISVTTDDEKGVAGYATALKPGKAMIAAVPVRLVNGVKTDIAGAKAATVTITVSDVTAPAIKKIAAVDNKVTFTYTKPANGYRREIFILEGKNKADDFETLIRTMNNGKWQGVFAVAPQYFANESLSDTKAKTVQKTINGLAADKTYTVYVRNVSGIRTLEDGSCVALSAKGTVKNFKTTKPQIEALSLYAKDDEEDFVTSKDVALSNKTEQLYVLGTFSAKNIDPAADNTDKVQLSLPLDKAYKKSLVEPKLSYTVSSAPTSIKVSNVRDFRYYTYLNGMYYKKTDIATVDKKGKVTLKGVGSVTITVKDETTGRTASVILNIHATADSIKAKNAKLAVGNRLYLSSLLTYYEGKTALTGLTDYTDQYGIKGTTYKPNLTIPVETVNKINSEGNFYIGPTGDGDYSITALKPNAVCDITAMDGSLSASLKIQSTPIEEIKNLTITDVVDNGFQINISYSVNTDLLRTTHRIDVTDERGNIVTSEIWGSSTYKSYDAKKKLYTQYTTTLNPPYHYTNNKIACLSKYSVTVTTIIGDEVSTKPVTKSVKTTDFPASYENLGTKYGGMAVTAYGVAGKGEYNKELSSTLLERRYLTSGNVYTLAADVEELAGYRMTDTLIWKSSNTKVASVKAKAGTYTAQLNALTPGSTVIEVTSKLTKKVIARWPVFVKAVGNAKDYYYGDYEYTGEYSYYDDPYYTSSIEVLTLQNPVRVTSSEIYDEDTNNSYANNDYKWVKFTAPAFGRYQFKCTGTLEKLLTSSERNLSASNIANHDHIFMLAEETFYFKLRGAFTMEVSDYTKQGASFTVDDGSVSIDSDSKQLIEFRATEDNVYTFYSKELLNLPTQITVYDENSNIYNSSKYKTWTDDDGLQKRDISLEKGEIIYLEVPAGKYTLYVEKRNAAELIESASLSLTNTVKEQWYTYTALEDGLYTFKSKDATGVLTAAYYKSLKDLNASDWNVTNNENDFSGRMMLEAGQKIVLKISADEAADAVIIVTPEIPVKLSVGEEKDISVVPDNRRWVSFQLSEAGRYRFFTVATETDAAYDVHLRYYRNAIEENEITTIEKNEIIVSNNNSNQPDAAEGDTIYVEITTDKEGANAADVKVSLTQVTATELTVGEELSITIKNGEEQWYTFTPPQKGNYIVQSVVTPNVGTDGEETKTHTLSAAWYARGLVQRTSSNNFSTIGAHDIYGEYIGYITAGIFKISADDLELGADGSEITTTATIIVKELTATPLEINQPVEISLLRNERKWFSFTAPETNTYIIKRNMTQGSVNSSYSNGIKTGTSHDISVDFYSIDLEAGETIYIEEHENNGGAATFTRSVEFPVKLSKDAAQTAVVTKENPAYYMFTADAATRYAFSYTVDTEDAEAIVSYGKSATADTWEVTNGYKELLMEENDRYFIKVSTTSETEVSVTLKAAPIEPEKLAIGTTENITVAARDSGSKGRYTWCSFTAQEPGRYVIGKSSSDYSDVEYYKTMTDSADSSLDNHYYKAGETVYITLSTTATEAQSTSVTVQKIEPAALESTSTEGTPSDDVSVDDTISTQGVLNTKGYLYTAQKTGLYTFTNESSRVNIKIYMEPSDNNGENIVSSSKSLLLKANDTIYIDALPSQDIANVKFTIALTDEPQMLSAGENTITLGEQNNKLTAFSAPDTGLYNFSIVYTGESSIGSTGTAYLMMSSQTIGTNPALCSSTSGNTGSIAFPNRLIIQDETVYLSIPKPSSATGATITVSKVEETIETQMVTEGTELERIFEDGDKVYYIFDVPEDGNYQVLAESRVDTGYCYYNVYYNEYGLSDSDGFKKWKTVVTSEEKTFTNLKKHQRVCFSVEKSSQYGNSFSAFAITITNQK